MSRGPGSVRVCMVGSANTDVVGRVSRLPRQGECLTGTSVSIGRGGKGANQAVMAARLGADVSVIARLGDDLFGAAYRSALAGEGIDLSGLVIDADHASGVAMILVEEGSGQNTIAYLPGANAALSVADLEASAERIAAADVCIAQLETPVETTLAAFRIAGSAGTRPPMRILNAAPVPVPAVPLSPALLASTEVLVANEEEAAWLAGLTIASVETACRAAAELARRAPLSVVITLGDRGVAWAAPGAEGRHQPAPRVRAVDTTGAGDAFVGALAVLLGSGDPLERAVARATEIASMTVGHPGAQSSYPTRAEVRSALGW